VLALALALALVREQEQEQEQEQVLALALVLVLVRVPEQVRVLASYRPGGPPDLQAAWWCFHLPRRHKRTGRQQSERPEQDAKNQSG